MFEYTQFSIKVHYYNKRGLKICLICYKLFRCSKNYELQRWQLLQPSNILLKSRFRICNLKLYKLVDDLSLLDSLLQSFGPRYLSERKIPIHYSVRFSVFNIKSPNFLHLLTFTCSFNF